MIGCVMFYYCIQIETFPLSVYSKGLWTGLLAFKQGRSLSCHTCLVYAGSSEEPPQLVAFFDKQGVLRTFSNPINEYHYDAVRARLRHIAWNL